MRPTTVENRQDCICQPSPSGMVMTWMPFAFSLGTMALRSAYVLGSPKPLSARSFLLAYITVV